ncbi:MAG: hypothetical protein WBL28_11395 [Methylotenera sp.]
MQLHFEPIPNRLVELCLRSGDVDCKIIQAGQIAQDMNVAVRIISNQYSAINLATGENLLNLEGSARITRGRKKHVDSEEMYPDAIIFYEPPYDEEKAYFTLQIHMHEGIFDKVVTLCQTYKMPNIYLEFDYMKGPIKFGLLPDNTLDWNNKNNREAIATGYGVSIVFGPKEDKSA